MSAMARIWGYSPKATRPEGLRVDRPTETAKAVRVTIREIDGEGVTVDTLWLPKSLAKELEVRLVRDDDGTTAFEVSALVPAWFVAKLDTRPGWARRGERCPEGQRPW